MSSIVTAISFARESNLWDKNEYSLDVQVEANQDNAHRDGLTIAHSFREKHSGVDLWAMPELTRLRSLLQATPGRKIVYVYAQDRLVRGEEGEDIFWLLVEFRRYQTEVRFHLNPVDLSSIAGKIQVLITGNEASNEIQKIIDRTWTRGRLKRMKEGKIPNAGPEKYGYRRNRDTGKAEIIEEQATHIRRAAELLEQGYGFSTVAQMFNREQIPSPTGTNWAAPTIHRWFTNPAYKGEGYGWRYTKKKGEVVRRRDADAWVKLADDAYPPIVEPARWDRIHVRIEANRGTASRNAKLFVLLRGLVTCDACGYSAYYTRGKDRQGNPAYGFYGCGRRDQQLKRSEPRSCFARRRSAADLEGQIWSQVCELLQDPQRLQAILHDVQETEAADTYQSELAALEKANATRLQELERLAKRLRTASDTIAEHIEAEMESVEQERKATLRRIGELQQALLQRQGREEEFKNLQTTIAAIADKLADAPDTLKRQILELLPFRYTLEGKILVSP